MTKRQNITPPEESKREPPKYIVSYSAMMTILLAFFIMLNNLATVREYGLKGAGLGAFRKSFNSLGLPGILPSSRKPVSLNAPGGKYVIAEGASSKAEGKPYDGRLIDPEEPDIGETLTSLLKVREEIVLPVPLPSDGRPDASTRRRILSIARLIRRGRSVVIVRAKMPHDRARSTALALRLARLLTEEGGIDPRRVCAQGRMGEDDGPAAEIMLRPSARPGPLAPYGGKPKRFVHSRRQQPNPHTVR